MLYQSYYKLQTQHNKMCMSYDFGNDVDIIWIFVESCGNGVSRYRAYSTIRGKHITYSFTDDEVVNIIDL